MGLRIVEQLRSKAGLRVNRQYKDRLFRFVFQEKKDLLELYNAVNGTDYRNEDELTITTIQDVVYLGMKNDIGFLIGYHMNLYEHQSSLNLNMPLRGLLYFANMLKAYVEGQGLDIYGSKKVALPTPRYIIFYNGTTDEPDRMELRLSDSFIKRDVDDYALECIAVMLNINYGHNRELMLKCRRLNDYAYFIQRVRDHLGEELRIEEAVERAMDECIRKGILDDVLRQNRAEVLNMLLTVYDEKLHNKTLREEGKEAGRKEGQNRINALNQKLLQDGRYDDMKRSVRDVRYQEELLKEYGL